MEVGFLGAYFYREGGLTLSINSYKPSQDLRMRINIVKEKYIGSARSYSTHRQTNRQIDNLLQKTEDSICERTV